VIVDVCFVSGGTMKSKITWQEGMAFEAELDGFKLMIDADKSVGGQGRGPKPKGLTLVSLAGCTGMDVISILRKMKVDVEGFEVQTEGVVADEHPRKFTEITLRYLFTGKDLPHEKLKKAINLSREKYCGVSATLAPTVRINTEILVNGEKIES
jgi:putative redox protein